MIEIDLDFDEATFDDVVNSANDLANSATNAIDELEERIEHFNMLIRKAEDAISALRRVEHAAEDASASADDVSDTVRNTNDALERLVGD